MHVNCAVDAKLILSDPEMAAQVHEGQCAVFCHEHREKALTELKCHGFKPVVKSG